MQAKHADRLTDTVSIRCSPYERKQWEKLAAAKNRTVGDWLRLAAAEYQILEPMTPEEFTAYYDAAKVLKEFGEREST